MELGRDHSWKENREFLGLLLGKILQKFMAHLPPWERWLQNEFCKLKVNVCSCEGISRRGDAGSL